MDNEIAGLYVRIGADFSELQSGLEETRLLVDSLGADGGILTGLVNQTINDLSRFVAGVRQGLAPLVPALQSGLQAPLQEAFRAVNAVLARETDAMISELYSAASRIHNLALSLNLPSPINATALYEGRAEGGQVTAGTPYVVGEAGPELFVPHTSGSIVPNHVPAFQRIGFDIKEARCWMIRPTQAYSDIEFAYKRTEPTQEDASALADLMFAAFQGGVGRYGLRTVTDHRKSIDNYLETIATDLVSQRAASLLWDGDHLVAACLVQPHHTHGRTCLGMGQIKLEIFCPNQYFKSIQC